MDAIMEYLEELMDLKRTASIQFRSADGGLTKIKGSIIKIKNTTGQDTIEIDAGMAIAVSQIMEINGRRFENIC